MAATLTTPDTPPTSDRQDRVRMLEVIEDAERVTRFCACGALMSVAADGGALWLECPAYRERMDGRLSWLRSGIRQVLHDRNLIHGLDAAA